VQQGWGAAESLEPVETAGRKPNLLKGYLWNCLSICTTRRSVFTFTVGVRNRRVSVMHKHVAGAGAIVLNVRLIQEGTGKQFSQVCRKTPQPFVDQEVLMGQRASSGVLSQRGGSSGFTIRVGLAGYSTERWRSLFGLVLQWSWQSVGVCVPKFMAWCFGDRAFFKGCAMKLSSDALGNFQNCSWLASLFRAGRMGKTHNDQLTIGSLGCKVWVKEVGTISYKTCFEFIHRLQKLLGSKRQHDHLPCIFSARNATISNCSSAAKRALHCECMLYRCRHNRLEELPRSCFGALNSAITRWRHYP